MEIIDPNQLNGDPKIGDYFSFGYVSDVDQVGDYLYVTDDSKYQHILNVSSPLSPTIAGRYEHLLNGAASLHVEGDTAFLMGSEELDLINITDPINPTRRATYLPAGAFPRLNEFLYHNGFGFLAGEFDVGSLNVIDFTDVNNPASVITVGSIGCQDGENLELKGNHLFLVERCNGAEQITAIDISNPISPQIGMGLSLGNSLVDIEGMAIAGNYAYLYVYDSGEFIKVIDISNPAGLNLVSSIPITTEANSSYVVLTSLDGALYLTSNIFLGFKQKYDLTNPTMPTLVGDYSYELGLPYSNAIYDPNFNFGLYLYARDLSNQIYLPFAVK